jgi:hypothetical protein
VTMAQAVFLGVMISWVPSVILVALLFWREVASSGRECADPEADRTKLDALLPRRG